MDKRTRRKIIIYFILFTALTAGITAALFPYFQKLADPACQKQIQQWIDQAGMAGLAAVFGLQVLQIIIAFIPGEPVELLSGILYGAAGGLAVCLSGCILASTLIFTLSKRFGKKLLYTLFNEKKVQSWKWLHDSRLCTLAVFLLFFIPGTPKDMLTYIIGVTEMRTGKFIAVSAFARIPSILSSTMIGATMRRGDWKMALLVFLITGIVGIVGIVFKERAVEFCRRGGKKRAA